VQDTGRDRWRSKQGRSGCAAACLAGPAAAAQPGWQNAWRGL